jgi:uncharacterized protein (DUF58 family)
VSAALDAPGIALRSDALIALRRLAMADAAPAGLAALPGGFATRRKGHGLEVADMREYVGGDDIRHIDRGTTARTGRLHVRQFQEERDRVCLLVADFRPAMFWGLRRAFRSVAAAEALTLIGWAVAESGGRVGLLALTDTAPIVVPPRGRARGMLDVIGGMVRSHEAALARMGARTPAQAAPDPPLDARLARAARLSPPGAEIIIASGFDTPGPALADRLDELARRRMPRLILVTDRQVERMPPGRYPVRLSDGRRLRLRLGGGGHDPGTDPETRDIEGRNALVVDAGAPLAQTARRLQAAFPQAALR